MKTKELPCRDEQVLPVEQPYARRDVSKPSEDCATCLWRAISRFDRISVTARHIRLMSRLLRQEDQPPHNDMQSRVVNFIVEWGKQFFNHRVP